jgi:hypothetical protein
MVATLIGTGAFVSGTTGSSVGLPAGWTQAAGDVALIYVVSKPSTATPATPASWSLAHTGVIGSGGEAADTGPLRLTIFRRRRAGVAIAAPTVGTSGTGAGFGAIMRAYRPAAGETVFTAVTAGADSTGDTTYAPTGFANVPFASDDLIDVLTGLTSDTPTITTIPTLAATGATFSALTQVSNNVAITGNDLRHYVHSGSVTAGTATAAPTLTAGVLSATIVAGSAIVAIRSAPLRRNLSANPALAVDASQWFGGVGWARVTGLTGFDRTTGWQATNEVGETVNPKTLAAASAPYSISVSVRCTNAVTVDCNINWYLAGAYNSSSVEQQFTPLSAGVVARIGVTSTAPAGIDAGLLAIHFPAAPGVETVTQHLAEQSATIGTYFDGDTLFCEWEGTAGQSTSIGPFVDVGQDLDGVDTFTLTDSGDLVAALDGVDTATVADTGELAAVLDDADSAALTEAAALGVDGADALALTEAAALVVTLDGVDAHALTELGAVAAALDGVDSLTLADAGEVAAALDGADTGTLGDPAGVLDVAGLDTWTLTDLGALDVVADGVDAFTLADVGALDVAHAGTDPFTLTDLADPAAADLAGADALALAELGELTADLADVDTATLADTPGELATGEFLNGVDTATLTEAADLAATADGVDTFTLGEGAALNADLALDGTDTAALGEAGQAAALLDGVDSAALAEAAVNSADLAGSDVLALAEQAVPGAGLDGADTFVLGESGAVATGEFLAGADTFALAEAATLAVTLDGVDTAGLGELASLAADLAGVDVFTLAELGSRVDLTNAARLPLRAGQAEGDPFVDAGTAVRVERIEAGSVYRDSPFG